MPPHSESSNGRCLEDHSRLVIYGDVLGKIKPPSFFLTSLLHRLLPISAQNYLRDTGFRPICDGAVVLTAAVTAVFHPKHARRFLDVGRRRRDYRYGNHPRQMIEVVQGVQPSEGQSGRVSTVNPPKLFVFVHGGAWGSGSTWMYRLMVERLSRLGYTVASIGYRVYPDADISGQVDDIAAAVRWISDNITEMGFDASPDVFIAGHSSGAHIAQLFLLRRAEAETKTEAETAQRGYRLEVKGFIGLSGVYDVYRHYVFEAWRGVHEVSPLKPVNGGSLHTLLKHSHPFLFSSAYLGQSHSMKSFDKETDGTTTMAAALRALSVPTTVHLKPGGEHFDTVGDLMFKEGSTVEAAILGFMSEEAAEKDRAERCMNIVSRLPSSRL